MGGTHHQQLWHLLGGEESRRYNKQQPGQQARREGHVCSIRNTMLPGSRRF